MRYFITRCASRKTLLMSVQFRKPKAIVYKSTELSSRDKLCASPSTNSSLHPAIQREIQIKQFKQFDTYVCTGSSNTHTSKVRHINAVILRTKQMVQNGKWLSTTKKLFARYQYGRCVPFRSMYPISVARRFPTESIELFTSSTVTLVSSYSFMRENILRIT